MQDYLPYLNGIIRTAIAGAGGWLVNQGLLLESQQEQFVGAGMLIVAILWSLYNKYLAKKEE